MTHLAPGPAPRFKNKPQLAATLLAACLAAGTQAGLAQLYSVDANTGGTPTMSGAAVLGASGDLWNGYTAGDWGPHRLQTLMDSTGSSLANVQVDIWNYRGSYDNTGGNTPVTPSELMRDYINAYGSGDGFPIKVQLSNLPVSTPFQLVVYAAGDTAGQGATVTLFDPSGNMVANTTAASRDISAGAGVAYDLFNGTTTSDGTVYFEVANVDTWHAFNGLQIQVVPEPSVAALSLGALALLTLVRRRTSR